MNKTLVGCDSIIVKGITYKTSTTLTDTVKSSGGCDSIYTNTIISINATPVIINVTINSPVNMGDSIRLQAAVGTTVDSIHWATPLTTYTSLNNSLNIPVATTSMSGSYAVTAINNGCISTAYNVNVLVNGTYIISGNIKNPQGKIIPNAIVSLTGSANSQFNTGSSGNYNFSVLPGITNTYKVKAFKNNDINKTNGVTAVDIALVQSHILQKSVLNSPLKFLSADVNNDGKVTALDIVFIKRLILGIDTGFTGGRLWSFVDSSFVVNALNPFPFKDSFSYTSLSANQTAQNFVGIKLGDVNWDWNSAILKPNNNSNTVELSYSTYEIKSVGNYLHIPVKVKYFKEMSGMQFTISFDPSIMQWQGLGNNPLGIETGTNHATKGSVSFLWVDPKNEIKTLEDGTVLMELVFKTIDNGKLIIDNVNTNTLTLDGSVTTVAAYDKDYGLHSVVMRGENVQPLQQDVWSVFPNPTKDGVIHVQMNLKDSKSIVFRLTDNTGRVLLVKQVEGMKEISNIALNIEHKLSDGVYYLQAIGIEGDKVKQLIIVN